MHIETNIPWIADFRDAWIDNPYMPLATPLHQLIQTSLEGKVLKKANRILVVSRAYKKSFLKRHIELNPNKIFFLPNGYDTPLFSNQLFSYEENKSQFTITHTGSFAGERQPDTFLRACKDIMIKKPELLKQWEINLLGPINPNVQNLIKDLDLEDIVYSRGYLIHKEAINYLMKSTINLLIVSSTGGHKEIIPGKLFEYIAAKRPILALADEDSEVAKIIKETNSGMVVKPNDPTKIREALEEYYQQFLDGNLKVESIGIEKFARRNLTNQLVEHLEEIKDKK